LFNLRRLKPAVNHILLYEQQALAIGAFIRSSLRSPVARSAEFAIRIEY